jgi:hypothetical protein
MLSNRQKDTILRLAPLNTEEVIAGARIDPYGTATVTVPSIYAPNSKMRVKISRDGVKGYT